jgi:hypothetical protein
LKALPFFAGSLPFLGASTAIKFVAEFSPHLPFLPQLPEGNPQEDPLAQTLRGVELGHWDEEASICLEEFQNEFVESLRVKIQVIGPYTLSRAISTPFSGFTAQWMRFWQGLSQQLRQAGFTQELWLQLDEPFWEGDRDLPLQYEALLDEVRSVRANLKVGIHSCHRNRPFPRESLRGRLDYLNFNFQDEPLRNEELALAQHFTMIWGILNRGESELPPLSAQLLPLSPWISAPCGLSEWSAQEIYLTFQNIVGA